MVPSGNGGPIWRPVLMSINRRLLKSNDIVTVPPTGIALSLCDSVVKRRIFQQHTWVNPHSTINTSLVPDRDKATDRQRVL